MCTPSKKPMVATHGSGIIADVSFIICILTFSFFSEKMAPVFTGFRCVGRDTQFLSYFTVNFGIVNKKSLFRVNTRIFGHRLEYFRFGLGHFHFIREIRLLKIVLYFERTVGEGILAYPFPVDVIGVAEQIDYVFLA